MVATIIVFRHGKVKSKENIFCGWLNLSLDSTGIAQAKSLGKKLKKEKIDFAFCSDLVRSKEVLVEVLKGHPHAKVIVDPRLRERHYGVLTGKSKHAFFRRNPQEFDALHRGYYADIPKGENFHDTSIRVFGFLNDLMRFVQSKKNCTVVISAHNNSLRLIQEYFEDVPKKDVEKLSHHPTDYKKYVLTFD